MFIIKSVNSCTFGQHYNWGLGFSYSSYDMNLNFTDVLHASIHSDLAYIVGNSSNISFVFFDCLSCAFTIKIRSINFNNTYMVPTGIATSSSFRLYQGPINYDTRLTNARVYWAFTYSG